MTASTEPTEPEPAATGDATVTGASAATQAVTGGTQAVTDPPAARSHSRGRQILAALFWLLSCVAIMAAGVTLWAHQTLLTSQGWGSIVAGVAADEEVIAGVSDRLVTRVSDAIGVQDIVAGIVPGEGTVIAAAVTGALEDRIADRLAQFAESEGFQDALVAVNEGAHDAAMAVIRDPDTAAVTSEQGTISLNVMPLVEGVLHGLQDAGVISADREIPDLSSYEPNPDRVAQLESLLGRDIPEDIGTITLIESDRLATVQGAVRAFDVITVGLLILAIVCVLLALALSARRLRMVLWLAFGAVVALLLGRGFVRVVLESVAGTIAGEGFAGVSGVIRSSVDSLMWFCFALIVVALIVAGLAIIAERRAAIAAVTGSPATLREWLRVHARDIGWIGIGIVAFVALWNVGGPDVTLLLAAVVGIILIGVSVLAGHVGGRDAAEPGAPEASP
jgi:hypothetical protein